MIKSFKCKETQKLWSGKNSGKIPGDIENRAMIKLLQLDASQSIEDLKVPPGNQLERLKGDRKDFYSIRINRQWRVCFQWLDGNAEQVEIVDYH